MKGEVIMEQTEGTQSTPDLDRIMLEGHPAFDGVTPLEGDAVPGSAVTPGPDAAGTEQPADDKAAEGLAAEQAAKEADEAARKTKADTPPETGSRFKSHEEAERGYRELQGKTTKAEQRAAELETELTRIRDAGKVEEAKAKNKTDLITYATTRRAQALEAIDGLDPDAADYRNQAASVLAAADADVLDYRDTLPAATHRREQPAATPAVGGDDATDTVKYVQATLQKPEIGLEADDPLFWTFAGQAPTAKANGEPIPFDDQITWAVEKTKSYHNKLRGTDPAKREEEAAARSRTLQEQDLSLGRGGSTRPAGADKGAEKPVSLSDAIDGALEQRRL